MGIPFVFDIKKIERELTAKSSLINICKTTGGHIASKHGAIVGRMGIVKVYDTCQRCHLAYERTPNGEEMETYHKLMKTEFTI